MKKFFTFLAAALFTMTSFAATVTFDVTVDKTETSIAAELTLTKDGVSIYTSRGILGNAKEYRFYKGQWVTISCEYGNITSVEFTCTKEGTAQYGPGCFEMRSPQTGTYTYEGNIGTWTGDAETVTLYATLNQVRATKIVVTYKSNDANFVAQPAIEGNVDFADSTEIAITAEEGLKIYYTLDGTEPTNASTEYTAPFVLTSTTTVKAIAYNTTLAKASMVTEQTFTQATKVTCAEAAALAVAMEEQNVFSELAYVVEGYVTDSTHSQSGLIQSFWVADTKEGGKVLYAYNSYVPEYLSVGTKVRIIGRLCKYFTGANYQPQIKMGQVTILPQEGPTVGFENTNATKKAVKFIENGQVFILRDGKKYTIQGVEVR
jgi:hypothetical protein